MRNHVSICVEHCSNNTEKVNGECKTGSCSVVENMGSERASNNVDDNYDEKSENGEDCDNHSLGSWKGSEIVFGSFPEDFSSVLQSRPAVVETASPPMRWADMTQENEFDEEEEEEDEQRDSSRKGFDASSVKTPEKPKLSRDQRENLRLINVKRKKDFICLERVKGKIVNVLDGLELHTGVFSAVEQKRIVDQVYQLQEKGRRGELKSNFLF